LSVGLTTQLTSLKKTISCIREECGSAVKIMIGGNGLKESPSLWQHIGADGYAGDLEEALIKADNLVT
jgi:methanogenic corrinoid protein MtbC1